SGSVLQLKPDIPVWTEIFPTPHTPHPIPCLNSNLFVTPSAIHLFLRHQSNTRPFSLLVIRTN
ncbi:MAG: hypothetical protein EWV45_10355, partial [Microcystis flos-aquae Mf_QC_C_20070823_S10D]